MPFQFTSRNSSTYSPLAETQSILLKSPKITSYWPFWNAKDPAPRSNSIQSPLLGAGAALGLALEHPLPTITSTLSTPTPVTSPIIDIDATYAPKSPLMTSPELALEPLDDAGAAMPGPEVMETVLLTPMQDWYRSQRSGAVMDRMKDRTVGVDGLVASGKPGLRFKRLILVERMVVLGCSEAPPTTTRRVPMTSTRPQ